MLVLLVPLIADVVTATKRVCLRKGPNTHKWLKNKVRLTKGEPLLRLVRRIQKQSKQGRKLKLEPKLGKRNCDNHDNRHGHDSEQERVTNYDEEET